MATGTVKWFNDAKGYGFITPDDGSEDLFAQFSAINMSRFKTLKEGQEVSLDVVQGHKGKQASDIQHSWEQEEQDWPPVGCLCHVVGLFPTSFRSQPGRSRSTRPALPR